MKIADIARAAGKPESANLRSVHAGLAAYGDAAGLGAQHRLAHYLAQLMHESAGFHYDREIASGKAYEGRADLGNTQPGDGVSFKGRGPIQITGRSNYAASGLVLDLDLLEHPELLEQPYNAALSAAEWWHRHGCNALADTGDLAAVTRKVNGGLTGLDDRLKLYAGAMTYIGSA